MAEPVPSDRSGVLRVAAAVFAGALGTVLVAAALWAVFRPEPPRPPQSSIEPAQPSAPSTATLPPSAESSPTSPSPSLPATRAPDPVTSTAGFTRAARIAFRLAGALHVARENGQSARQVAVSAEGPYALSPDATRIAIVEGGALTIVDVASGKQVALGAAEAAAPVWLPDSSALLFVRLEADGKMRVYRVDRDGRQARMVHEGIGGAVSPDGKTIAVRLEPGTGPSVAYVSRSGKPFTQVTLPSPLTAIALTNDRLIAGLVDNTGVASVVSVGLDGKGPKQLLAAPSGPMPAVWGELYVSPSGRSLAAVAVGDDGYSRLSVVPAAGGTETRVTRRRDAYFRSWSAGGSNIFVIEGNSFQGESTSLVRMLTDGSGRTVLVEGAE